MRNFEKEKENWTINCKKLVSDRIKMANLFRKPQDNRFIF